MLDELYFSNAKAAFNPWFFCIVPAGSRAGAGAASPPLYYNTSSANVLLNMLGSVATNGSGDAILIAATGVDGNKLNRCTAVAVDGLNGKLFLIDGAANAVWSVNLNGSGLTLVRSGLTNFPTDLALDVLNQKIYYTTSSTIQNNNTVQRMDYTGNNNTTLFIASGPPVNGGNGASRCTAIAVDLLNSKIFIADAGTQKIWSTSLAGTGLDSAGNSRQLNPHRPRTGCHQPAGLFYLEQSRAKRERHSADEL